MPASTHKVEVKPAAMAIVNTLHYGNLPPASAVADIQNVNDTSMTIFSRDLKKKSFKK